MSRLRARTWTALERRVMKAWKFWNGFVVPIEALVADGEVLHQARGIFVDAERIMRTKGIDLYLARQRALADYRKSVDPVTGIGYSELIEIGNDVNGRRWRERRIRWFARAARKRYSPHANRKYPLRGLYRSLPSHPSRPVGPTNDVWFDYGPWVPSDFNPNIYVRAL